MALEKTSQNTHRSYVFQPHRQNEAQEQPMDLKEMIQKKNHEQVVAFNDSGTGLFGFIAIHDTTLGPALGGCRMWPYDNTEQALIDALRLSRGMTYKASLAGLNLGGGKSVIIGDAKKDKSEELFRAFGQFVDSDNGMERIISGHGKDKDEHFQLHNGLEEIRNYQLAYNRDT